MKKTTTGFKIGRRKHGDLVTLADGTTILRLMRSQKEIFRGKENSFISHAIEEGVAGWSVETAVLARMRTRNIQYLAIKVRETNDQYLTTLDRFSDNGHMLNKRKKNGFYQRTLGFEDFQKRAGKVKL